MWIIYTSGKTSLLEREKKEDEKEEEEEKGK